MLWKSQAQDVWSKGVMAVPQCVTLLLLLFFFGVSGLWASPEAVEYRYRVTPDGGSSRIETRRVVCQANGDIFIRNSGRGETGFMEVRADDEGAFWQHLVWENSWVKIRRAGSLVETNGEIDGNAVQHSDRLDDLPWYPDFNLLGDFALSDEAERRFYLLLPAGPRLLKMVARREGPESITLGGRRVETIRVRIQAEGLFGLFWNQPFWYRASDGILVRYRSREGPPGEPEVLVELIGAR